VACDPVAFPGIVRRYLQVPGHLVRLVPMYQIGASRCLFRARAEEMTDFFRGGGGGNGDMESTIYSHCSSDPD